MPVLAYGLGHPERIPRVGVRVVVAAQPAAAPAGGGDGFALGRCGIGAGRHLARGRGDGAGLLRLDFDVFWSAVRHIFLPALAALGEPNTFGVFVRSDTNVEDLKEFTGAGLNLPFRPAFGYKDSCLTVRFSTSILPRPCSWAIRI